MIIEIYSIDPRSTSEGDMCGVKNKPPRDWSLQGWIRLESQNRLCWYCEKSPNKHRICLWGDALFRRLARGLGRKGRKKLGQKFILKPHNWIYTDEQA